MERFMDENIKKNLLLQAEEFEEAYQRCARGENPYKDETGRTVYHVLNLPAVVNAAFSCELYLKFLIGSKCPGHDLEQLFQRLDPKLQNEIRDEVASEIQSYPLSFDELLKRAKDVFKEWRYLYERPHTDTYLNVYINEYLIFLPLLIDALKRRAYDDLPSAV